MVYTVTKALMNFISAGTAFAGKRMISSGLKSEVAAPCKYR